MAMIRSEVERRGLRMEHWGVGEERGGEVVGGATNGVVNGNGAVIEVAVGSGASAGGGVQGNLSAVRDLEVAREVAPTAVGVEDEPGAVTSTGPPSQPPELDPINHPSPTGAEDDGVYL